MFEPANKPPVPFQIEVTLDGEAVALPNWNRRSLAAIRAHLEVLALRQQRILFSLSVDGADLNLVRPIRPIIFFQRVSAVTIGFEQLGRQLLAVALEQVDMLLARVEAAALVVLINDWPANERLWWDLLPDLKEPVLAASLLPEFQVTGGDGGPAIPPEVKAQVEQLGSLLGDFEGVCRRHDSAELSDALELRLKPWLQQLQRHLHELNAASPG